MASVSPTPTPASISQPFQRAIDDAEQLVRLFAARRERVDRSEVVVLLDREPSSPT